jgi:hypothetical protein
LTGALVNADGTAWAPATGYSVASLVAERANNVVTGYTAYAYKSGNAPDRTDLLKYSFAASGSNWQVSAATQFGVAVNAADLAAAESTTSRDLNGDGKFGVDLQLTALDSEGGLYKGQAFGQTYVLAGTNLSSSANGALNLSKALLNADGTAWAPSALSDATAKLRVIVSGAGNQASYDVYLTTNQGSQLTSGVGTATYNKYTFDHNYTLVGNSQSLTTEEFAAAEKAAAKDLNADQKFGVNITSAVDARGGLYRGSLDSKGGVYFWGSANLTPGSKVAADALDFDSALKTAAGFWTPDSGYTVKSAVNDSNSNSLTVIAVNGTNDIKKYVFDTSASGKSTLQGADSGDMGLADLVSLENTATRDLNGDGIVGVSITATHDALGGLFKVSAGNKTIVSLGGANAVAPTDLDKALLATDGSFWSATGTVDRYVLVSAGAGANATYTVYTKAGSDYTEYTFGADYTLDASKTRSTLAANDASGAATLDAIKLADLEKDSGRDINGDSVVGAKVTKTLVANTLYEASMNGNTYTVMNQSMSGNTTRLVDASLRNADGSRWSVDAAYTIKAALVNTVGGSTASTEVYAINGSNAGKRYSFDAKGTLLKADAVTAEQIANAGNLGSLNPSSVDAIGGLFKATVLGADFYVVGSGAGNATAPTDLSQALLIGRNGNAAAWSPNTGAGNNGADGTGFKVAGLVANLTNNAADSYDVYAYKTNASGDVTDVFKSSWDNNFLYQGTVRADPAALVDVESGTGRDLNADGAIGFRLVGADATQATFKGVSVGQVGGYSATYLLAGTDLTPGTASAPLGMDKALLNQAGTAAWMPDSSYKVMAVTDGSSNSTRYVYALKAGANGARDEYLRYEFTKATGKSIGAGVAISATEMAAREVNDIKDLTGDGQVGVVSVSDYRVLESGNPTGASTGLLKANFGGKTYFVVNSMPSNGGKLDLSKALLASDGVTPWSIPTSNGSASFAIKGIYENNQGTSNNSNDDILEVYGTDNSGDVQSFKFSKQVDSAGNYTGAYIQMLASIGSTTPNDLTGFQLARAEYASTVDLNADGIVGFKASATPYKIESPSLGSYSLGQASVGSSQIYFVTDNYAVAKADPSGAAVKAGALMVNDGTTLDVGLGAGLSYWSPVSSDSTVAYDVKSIVSLNAGGNVEVWAEQTTNGTSDGYVKFAFARDANNNWVLDNSSYAASNALTEDEVIAEEANGGYTADSNYQVSGDYAARDINADGVVGLRLGSVSASGATSSVYKASIGSSDYYLVGTDLSSGTETNPLKLDTTRILMNNAGSSVWSPTGAVSGWSTVDPQTALALVAGGMADTPTYQLDDGGTTVYFTYDSNASLFRVAA